MRQIILVAALALGALLVLAPPGRAADPEVQKASETLQQYRREPFEQKKRAAALRDLGRIGGAEAAAAVLPVFGDRFEHLADRAVSAWIAMVKGERADETVAWLGKRGLSDRRPAVRAGAATALGFAACPEAGAALGARVRKERDPEVLVAILGAWARGDARRTWNPAEQIRHRDGRVVLAAVEALRDRTQLNTVPPAWRESALRHKAPLARAAGILFHVGAGTLSVERAQAVLTDADEVPRIALAEALAAEHENLPWDPVGRELLRSLLADASWRVRARAIQSVVSQWKADGVPLLVSRLDAEDGRLRLDLADALSRITGKAIGSDAELWRAWWEAKGKTFDPGPRPRGRRPRLPDAKPAGETKTTTFFRLPVVSTRVAFLIDCSGSMRDSVTREGTTGRTKMDLAREEVARTLGELGSEVRFDVFLYRYPSKYEILPEMTRVFKRLEPCKRGNAKKAVTWLAKQPAKGWGAYSDALEALLTEDVDTIFFLADGRPSRGRYDRDFRLLAELERWNRFRQVVVHTVLVGQKRADRQFLEALAELTGGHFADATRRTGER